MVNLDKLKTQVDKWHERTQYVQDAHYDSSLCYERFYLALGGTIIALSAITGSSDLMGTENDYMIPKEIAGLISFGVTILAGLQTFLNFSKKSERHHMAGARYGAIRRDLEELGVKISDPNENVMAEFHSIKIKMDALACECPELPHYILKKYKPKSH